MFDLLLPVMELHDDDVDNLGVVITNGDDDVRNDSKDNPTFCHFGNARVEDIDVVNSGSIDVVRMWNNGWLRPSMTGAFVGAIQQIRASPTCLRNVMCNH